MTSPPGGPEGGFGHDLLVHDSDEQLHASVAAFVEEGLAAGGEVVVFDPGLGASALGQSLPRHLRVAYRPAEPLMPDSVRGLFAAQLRQRPSPPPPGLWAVGVVAPDEAARAAWPRLEALANVVLAGLPLRTLCTYDTRTLSPDVVDVGRATHRFEWRDGARDLNPAFRPPEGYLSARGQQRLMPPPGEATVTTILTSTADLSLARRVVRPCLTRAGLEPATVSGFLTALNEVLVNALTHGAAPVWLRLWATPHRLTCEVVDSGRGVPDVLAGCRPPVAGGPLGLWVARQTCDDLDIHNLDNGCAVVLTTT
ncbi:MAG TPA: sensor histidine kinase [Oryzihumus sp.]|nr:sensor histidine kinase [Oryzihumus sp.]